MTGENRAHHGSQRQRDLVSQGAQCPCGPWSARPHQPAHHQPEIEYRDLQEHALGDVVGPYGLFGPVDEERLRSETPRPSNRNLAAQARQRGFLLDCGGRE